MIITGGSLRGRKFQVAPGERTRPTPARVKEALFSILRERIESARILDLFAGSGALGFEAISRGAEAAVFVEGHVPTARLISEAAVRFGVADQCTVVTERVEGSLRRLRGNFDIVFADPPYALAPPLPFFVELLAGGFLRADGVIAYEHHADQPALDVPSELELWRESTWGEVGFRFLKKAHGSALKNADSCE